MNYITHERAVSLFPVSTLSLQRSWVCRTSLDEGTAVYQTTESWRKKYSDRGFSIVGDPGWKAEEEPGELRANRWTGDPWCWNLHFDRERMRILDARYIYATADYHCCSILRSFIEGCQSSNSRTDDRVPDYHCRPGPGHFELLYEHHPTVHDQVGFSCS